MPHEKEMANVPVEQFHQSNEKGSDYHKSIDTIHSVKGATFDAILLFFSKDSRGESISLNDFPQNEIRVMTEGQRMIYVAYSSPTRRRKNISKRAKEKRRMMIIRRKKFLCGGL